MTSFSEQIAAFNRKAQKRLEAVSRGAVQDTAELAQMPRGQGGRLPIVTGFLRASLVAAVGQMPSGETTAVKGKDYTGDNPAKQGGALSEALLLWDPNAEEVFYLGWSAAYALRMEYGFTGTDSLGRKYDQQGLGFLRGATELWDQTVEGNARHVIRRIP